MITHSFGPYAHGRGTRMYASYTLITNGTAPPAVMLQLSLHRLRRAALSSNTSMLYHVCQKPIHPMPCTVEVSSSQLKPIIPFSLFFFFSFWYIGEVLPIISLLSMYHDHICCSIQPNCTENDLGVQMFITSLRWWIPLYVNSASQRLRVKTFPSG